MQLTKITLKLAKIIITVHSQRAKWSSLPASVTSSVFKQWLKTELLVRSHGIALSSVAEHRYI